MDIFKGICESVNIYDFSTLDEYQRLDIICKLRKSPPLDFQRIIIECTDIEILKISISVLLEDHRIRDHILYYLLDKSLNNDQLKQFTINKIVEIEEMKFSKEKFERLCLTLFNVDSHITDIEETLYILFSQNSYKLSLEFYSEVDKYCSKFINSEDKVPKSYFQALKNLIGTLTFKELNDFNWNMFLETCKDILQVLISNMCIHSNIYDGEMEEEEEEEMDEQFTKESVANDIKFIFSIFKDQKHIINDLEECICNKLLNRRDLYFLEEFIHLFQLDSSVIQNRIKNSDLFNKIKSKAWEYKNTIRLYSKYFTTDQFNEIYGVLQNSLKTVKEYPLKVINGLVISNIYRFKSSISTFYKDYISFSTKISKESPKDFILILESLVLILKEYFNSPETLLQTNEKAIIIIDYIKVLDFKFINEHLNICLDLLQLLMVYDPSSPLLNSFFDSFLLRLTSSNPKENVKILTRVLLECPDQYQYKSIQIHDGLNRALERNNKSVDISGDLIQFIVTLKRLEKKKEFPSIHDILTNRIVCSFYDKYGLDDSLKSLDLLVYFVAKSEAEFIDYLVMFVGFLSVNLYRDISNGVIAFNRKEIFNKISDKLAEVLLTGGGYSIELMERFLYDQFKTTYNFEFEEAYESLHDSSLELKYLDQDLKMKGFPMIQFEIMIQVSFKIGYDFKIFDYIIYREEFHLFEYLSTESNEHIIRFIDHTIEYLPRIHFRNLLFKYPELVGSSKEFKNHKSRLIDKSLQIEIKAFKYEYLYYLLDDSETFISTTIMLPDIIIQRIIQFTNDYSKKINSFKNIALVSKKFFNFVSKYLSNSTKLIKLPLSLNLTNIRDNINDNYILKCGVAKCNFDELHRIPEESFKFIEKLFIDSQDDDDIQYEYDFSKFKFPNLKKLHIRIDNQTDLYKAILEPGLHKLEDIRFEFSSEPEIYNEDQEPQNFDYLTKYLCMMDKERSAVKSLKFYFYDYNDKVLPFIKKIKNHFGNNWLERLKFGYYGCDPYSIPANEKALFFKEFTEMTLTEDDENNFQTIVDNCQSLSTIILFDYSFFRGRSFFQLFQLKSLKNIEISTDIHSVFNILELCSKDLKSNTSLEILEFLIKFSVNDLQASLKDYLEKIFKLCDVSDSLKVLSLKNIVNEDLPILPDFSNINTGSFSENFDNMIFKRPYNYQKRIISMMVD